MAATIRDEGVLPAAGEPQELFEAVSTRPTRKPFQIQGGAHRLFDEFPSNDGDPVARQITLDWPTLLR